MNGYVSDFSPTVQSYYGELHRFNSLDRNVEDKLIILAKNGDVDARNKVVMAHLKFVFNVASKYKGCGVDMEELISEGNCGLINAIDRFDNTRGIKFITYAMFCVKEKILERIKNKVAISTVEADANELENGKPITTLYDEEDDSACIGETIYFDNDVDNEETKERINKDYLSMLMGVLNEREKFVINKYFGVGCKEMKLAEIGKELGITKERARQIKVFAMRKLRSEALATISCMV